MTKLAVRTAGMKPGTGQTSVRNFVRPCRRRHGYPLGTALALAGLGFVLVNLATGCSASLATGEHPDPRVLALCVVGLMVGVSVIKVVGRLFGEAFRVVFEVVRTVVTLGLALAVVIGAAALAAAAVAS